jgi:hypothetical protein
MSYRDKRPLSTAELLALLDEDDDLANAGQIDAVYIPPNVDEITDEEDIDDDLLVEDVEIADVAGTFEVHAHAEQEQVHAEQEHEPDEPTPSTSFAKRTKQSKSAKNKPSKPKEIIPNWKQMEPRYTSFPNSEESSKIEDIVNAVGGKSPYEVFSLYFDSEVLTKIVDYSNKYAHDNNRHLFQLNIVTLKKFIGILILTGYHTLPAAKLYWSKDEDMGLPLVRKCMSRNKFMTIKQNIHLSDNNKLDENDKFSKLRPVFDMINEKNLQFGIFSHNLSIDEEMVPYFGRHSCKMFIRGKPVRFGFKHWCLCSSNGYLYKFIPYGGKRADNERSELSLGEQVVRDLLSVVNNPIQHRIYFDNFFSSYRLFHLLKRLGFFATGTIRENRTAKCTLEPNSTFKKRERGSFDFAFEEESEVMMVKWNDNSIVTVASNNGTIQPLAKAKRYNRKERKSVLVPQPKVIFDYNQQMGGVDLHDNGIANYRIRVRGKKWWWPLFINLIDSVIVNAWKIHGLANKEKMTQLKFRSYLAMTLMKFEGTETQEEQNCDIEETVNRESTPLDYGRPSKDSLPNEVRCDRVGHFIVEEENKKRRRCRLCKSTTIYKCKKCNVHLHTNCFETFHQ